MRDKYLVYGSPEIDSEECEEVMGVLKSGWLGTGPKVSLFQEEFAKYKDTSNAMAVSSCTAALHLSLIVAGIKPGDEVLTTAMTFCATVNAIIHAGGVPVLCDVDEKTYNIDPSEIEKHISPKTKAIVIVHFAGFPCEMDAIVSIATCHNLALIEDCAHSIESEYKGKKIGTFGDFGCFSFYVTKNIITGEGGMVITDNDKYAENIQTLSLHGMSRDAWKRFSDDGYKHYRVVECGYKYNMTDMQAALGIHQLKKVESNWNKRKMIWDFYMKEMSDFPLTLPADVNKNNGRHAYHLFAVRVQDQRGISRDRLLQLLHHKNIGTGVHYLSIPQHPYYQAKYGWNELECPIASNIGDTTFSIPLSPYMSLEDAQDVVNAIKESLL